MDQLDRVVIVGTGLVGATTAYALLLSGIVNEIVLIDRDRERAEAHVQDLRDAALYSRAARVRTGDFADCTDAAVTVIAAGVSQTRDMGSRLDDLKQSAVIVHGLVTEIARVAPRGVLLLASNPVDVLTFLAWQWSGLPPGRVMGSGTSLDTARFRWRLGDRFGVAADNVHAYIVGEHGDSQTAAVSSARIGGLPIEQFCRDQGFPYDETGLRDIANETKQAGLRIVHAKGGTSFGIASALVRIVTAVVRDERAVLTVSTRVPPSMQLGDVCLSLPAVVSREGATRVLRIPMNDAEAHALRASADILRRHVAAGEPAHEGSSGREER